MTRSAGEDYLQPYREAVLRHGPGFEATLWGTREAQALRFDVMIDLAGFDGATIVDVGCGHGDFAAHLLEREVAFASFAGLDALPEVVERARARDLARASFAVADPVADPTTLVITPAGRMPDWFAFSGTLNTMSDAAAQQLVRAAFDACAQGVVFNFLSNRAHARWADRALAPARRFDTVSWIDWALGITSRVAFTQDYLDGHDATISLRRE